MKYTFLVTDESGDLVFHTEKPNLELFNEEVGRWERIDKHKQNENKEII